MLTWALLSALSCKEPEPWCVPAEGASVTVCTEDEAGGELTVREVVWYRDVDDPDYDGEHDAVCANDACSVWAVEGGLTGEINVAARYYGPPHYTPGCAFLDSASALVTLDGLEAPLVTLELDTTAEECND